MSIAITLNRQDVFGNRRYHQGKFALDSAYPFGGYSLTPHDLGLAIIDQVMVEGAGGVIFEYNHSTNKLQAFSPAPPIVWEEQQMLINAGTVGASITLNYPPAYIFYVGQGSGPIRITDPAASLQTSQCQPSAAFSWGARSTLYFSANITTASVYVGYITQAWKEVWDNLVQGETHTVTANACSLTYRPVAIQSIRSGGTIEKNACDITPPGEGLPATTMVRLTPATQTLFFSALDTIISATATYIKKPSSGFLAQRTVVSEAMSTSTWSSTAYPMLLWGYGGMAPVFSEGVGQVQPKLIPIVGTVAASLAKFGFVWGNPHVQINSVSSVAGLYVWGMESEIPGLRHLEIRDGNDLSYQTDVKFFVVGS